MTKLTSKLPALLLIFGAILRIVGTGSAAIWYDESVIVYRSGLPFMQLLTNQSDLSGDLLVDLLVRPLMAISHSLWLLRLPSMLAGLVSLWLVWKLMQRLSFSLGQQLITSVFMAFLPGLIWIGQDARSYGLVGLLLLGSLWFTLENNWLGTLSCCGLLPYCHSTAVLYGGAILLINLYLRPHYLKRTVLLGLAMGLAWLPAIARILINGHVAAALQPWSPTISLNWFLRSVAQAIWTTTGYSTLHSGMIIILLLLTVPLLFSNIKNLSRVTLLLAWTAPLGAMIAISIFQNILLYRTVMPMLYPFGLWLGWELGHSQSVPQLRDRLAQVLWVPWGTLLLVGLVTWSPAARGAGLDLAAAQIRSEWQAGDLLVYVTKTTGLPFNYYLGDLPHYQDPDVASEFLQEPGIHIPDTGSPATARRIWLVLPENEKLVTPAEATGIERKFPHSSTPEMRLVYMQAAPISIYLVEEK
jgi:hypothetical protein